MEPITRSEMLMDGQYVEPITRKEKILSGEDLEPITREEYFLKKYRHSGGDVDVVQLTATENKTYTAPEGKAYNPVKVNVPEPVLDSITINENGHFTPPAGTDGYDDITVYVPYVTQGTTINENGDYTPPAGVDGFGRVIVDVPTPPPSLQSLTASHNGYFLPSSGYVGFSEVNVDVALPQNAYLLESQKDDVVSIQHGAEFDMPKLIASIEPQQDLHGYDSPWVGGAGKNLLPMTVDSIKSMNKSGTWSGNSFSVAGVVFTIQTDGANNVMGIYANGTATSNIFFNLGSILNADIPASTVVNGCPSGGVAFSTYQISINDSVTGDTPVYDIGNGATFAKSTFSGNAVVIIRIGNRTTVNSLVFKPMVRDASITDPTFAPYSNECPISGWTACNVVRTGKNLLNITDCSYENGTVTVKDGLVKINGTFNNRNLIISSDVNIAELNDLYGKELTFSKTDVKGNMEANPIFFTSSESWSYWHMSNATNKGTITLNKTLTNLVFYLDGTFDVEFYLQIELGSTATEYEPYDSNTYTINFVDGSNPLTVYKGEFDVLSGSLKVYPHYDSYNGETINGEWISDRDVYAEGTTPTIGAEVQVMSGSDYTTYQQVANNIKSLEGVNNIYADTGEVDVQIWTKEV
jgi:hypothetical protein